MRKWAVNGCAYYEDGSDTNVVGIEKDIEILKNLLTFKGKGLEYALEKKSIKAIENILQDYARQKQINEEQRYRIIDKIQERKFELQQEYKNFEGDEILQVLEALLKESEE